MNTHSWVKASPPANSAGAMLRDADDVHQSEGQALDHAAPSGMTYTAVTYVDANEPPHARFSCRCARQV